MRAQGAGSRNQVLLHLPRYLVSFVPALKPVQVSGLPRAALSAFLERRGLRWRRVGAAVRDAIEISVTAPVVSPRRTCARVVGWEGRCVSVRRDGENEVLFFPGCRVLLRPGAGAVVSAYQASGGEGSFVPPYEAGLNVALVHAMALRGGLALHGAAFLLEGQGVLALGRSRAGKSTLAAGVLRSGGQVVTDDVGIGALVAPGRVAIGSFRSGLVLRASGKAVLSRRIGKLSELRTPAGEKAWLLRRDDCPRGFADKVVPSSVWLVSVDRRRHCSAVSPVASSQAAVALIQASVPRFLTARYTNERAALMPVIKALAGLPAFRVRLGRRLLEEPEDEMRRLLELTRG